MKRNSLRHAALCTLIASTSFCPAAVVQVTPGLNNIPIEQIVFDINGIDFTQNTEAIDVDTTSDTAVNIKSVRIDNGAPVDLTFFNTAGSKVVNVNPQLASISGIGVFKNGVTTTSTDGPQAYAEAYAATTEDTDLRNFAYHDYLAPNPPTTNVPDLDVLFFKALNVEDYFLVCERWGNAQFQVTALMADGTPYPNAKVLSLGGNGGTPGNGFEVYDWNTGFAALTNQSTQAQACTVFSVSLFFDDPQSAGPVYGLRIDNDGEADPKILGISDNTFSDNPDNPLIPEPSVFLMALAGGMLMLGSRNRARATC